MIPHAVLALCLVAIASASAQTDRRSFEFYRANLEKYLGKEITVQATGAERKDTGELGDVALFQVYTASSSGISYAYVAVPLPEVKSFAQRYANKRGYYYDSDARPLRGKLTKGSVAIRSGVHTMTFDSGGLYISFKDAVLPDPDSTADDNTNQSEQKQPE